MPNRSNYEKVGQKTHATTAAELKPYGVTPYEASCRDCQFCKGRIYLSFAVLRRFKWVRDLYQKTFKTSAGLTVNSGYRCRAKQQWLWDNATPDERALGLVARPGSSPHEYGEALDVMKPPQFASPVEWGNFIIKACKGDVRVGCLKYKVFAHMDTMFLLAASKGKGVLW